MAYVSSIWLGKSRQSQSCNKTEEGEVNYHRQKDADDDDEDDEEETVVTNAGKDEPLRCEKRTKSNQLSDALKVVGFVSKTIKSSSAGAKPEFDNLRTNSTTVINTKVLPAKKGSSSPEDTKPQQGNTMRFMKNLLLKKRNPFKSDKAIEAVACGHVVAEEDDGAKECQSCSSRTCSADPAAAERTSANSKTNLEDGKKFCAIRRHRTSLFRTKERPSRATSVDPCKRFSLPLVRRESSVSSGHSSGHSSSTTTTTTTTTTSSTTAEPLYANACQLLLLADCNEDSESLSSSGLSGSYSSLFDSNVLTRKIEHRFNQRPAATARKCPLVSTDSGLKRHYSVDPIYEPIYANSCTLGSDPSNDHQDNNVTTTTTTNSQLGSLSASVSSILDYKLLVRKIEHKYHNQQKKCSLVSSKSMFNFSRNIFHSTPKNGANESSPCQQQHHPHHHENQAAKNLNRLKNRTQSSLAIGPHHQHQNHVTSDTRCSASHDKSLESLLYLTSKPISVSLLDATSNQLKQDHIDLTKEPYSDPSGFCGIPPSLVQRYSEELQRDIYEIADTLDHIRLAALLLKGRRGVPNDFLADACVGLTCEQANYDSLSCWLVSLGLPMYESALKTHGVADLLEVAKMRENDFIVCGISCKSHVRSLTTAVGALNMKM